MGYVRPHDKRLCLYRYCTMSARVQRAGNTTLSVLCSSLRSGVCASQQLFGAVQPTEVQRNSCKSTDYPSTTCRTCQLGTVVPRPASLRSGPTSSSRSVEHHPPSSSSCLTLRIAITNTATSALVGHAGCARVLLRLIRVVCHPCNPSNRRRARIK
jgi:hypothetical protein